ncbi:hypothetical protein Ancab_016373, partial [Ancistrocladus abbreviatus]
PWLEFSSVKARFSCLLRLASNPKVVISELGTWMGNGWTWNLTWKRELRETEKSWEQGLLLLLARYQPDRESVDVWKWGKDGTGCYTVQKAYNLLTSQSSVVTDDFIQELSKAPFLLFWANLVLVPCLILLLWGVVRIGLPGVLLFHCFPTHLEAMHLFFGEFAQEEQDSSSENALFWVEICVLLVVFGP